MEHPTYLAKEGKVSGPFDAAHIEKLKLSGEFYKYEWMWDGQSPDWAPVPRKLTTPPSFPPTSPEPTKTLTRVPVESAVKASPKAVSSTEIKKSSKTFCAVLFDTRVTIGGEVSQAHSRGGRFVSTPTQQVPVSRGSQALLDLLDEATDRSTKVQTSVTNVSRMGDRWVLELEWSGLPLLDP